MEGWRKAVVALMAVFGLATAAFAGEKEVKGEDGSVPRCHRR